MIYAHNFFTSQHFCSIFLAIKCFVKLLEFQWERIVLFSLLIYLYSTAMNLNLWLNSKMTRLTSMLSTNITSDSCQFLDLEISYFQGYFNARVYNRRDDFFVFPYGQFSLFWWWHSFGPIMRRLHFPVRSFCTYL